LCDALVGDANELGDVAERVAAAVQVEHELASPSVRPSLERGGRLADRAEVLELVLGGRIEILDHVDVEGSGIDVHHQGDGGTCRPFDAVESARLAVHAIELPDGDCPPAPASTGHGRVFRSPGRHHRLPSRSSSLWKGKVADPSDCDTDPATVDDP